MQSIQFEKSFYWVFTLCQILLIFSSKIFIIPVACLPSVLPPLSSPYLLSVTCQWSGPPTLTGRLCLCSTFFKSPSSLRDLPKWYSLARYPLVKYSPVTPRHPQDTVLLILWAHKRPTRWALPGLQPPRAPPPILSSCKTPQAACILLFPFLQFSFSLWLPSSFPSYSNI